MTDRPIIFSAPMVRALLDGCKTMTRRILKPQPEQARDAVGNLLPHGILHIEGEPRPRITTGRVITKQEIRWAIGDRLWVRETWAQLASGSDFAADIHPAQIMGSGPWRSPIHMPRWASRLTLIVTAIKIERLQDISDEDCIAEGVAAWRSGWSKKEAAEAFLRGTEAAVKTREGSVAQRLFYLLWTGLHGEDAWDANPYVVALTFTVHRCNIDALGKEAA